jgi:hypothetical protein
MEGQKSTAGGVRRGETPPESSLVGSTSGIIIITSTSSSNLKGHIPSFQFLGV